MSNPIRRLKKIEALKTQVKHPAIYSFVLDCVAWDCLRKL